MQPVCGGAGNRLGAPVDSYRLTQRVDVLIYKVTGAETVEERIHELQNKKRLLAEATIEGGILSAQRSPRLR